MGDQLGKEGTVSKLGPECQIECEVVVNELECDIDVSELKLYLRYYVHFHLLLSQIIIFNIKHLFAHS